MAPDRLPRLRHDLANPLSTILAESQLLLLGEAELPEEAVRGLRAIEAAALKMRVLLNEMPVEEEPG